MRDNFDVKALRQLQEKLGSIATSITENQSERFVYYRSAFFQKRLAEGRLFPFLAKSDSGFAEAIKEYGGVEFAEFLEAVSQESDFSFVGKESYAHERKIAYAGSELVRALITDLGQFYPEKTVDLQTSEIDMLIIGMPAVDVDANATDFFCVKNLSYFADKVTERFRKAGIPVVVVTTNDPHRINATASIAKYADVLVTFSADSVHEYSERVPASTKIVVSEPVFSPSVSSPIGRNRWRHGGALFAGSMPVDKARSGVRRAFLEVIEGFEASNVPLTIVDKGMFDNDAHSVHTPWRFAHWTVPKLKQRSVEVLPKHFDYSLVANLYPTSNTNFPLECTGLLASGSIPVGTYSVGMNNSFPQVLMPRNREDVELELSSLQSDPDTIYELQMNAIRKAFSQNNVNRLGNQLAQALGLPETKAISRVAVLGKDDKKIEDVLSRQILDKDIIVEVVGDKEAVSGYQILAQIKSNISYGPHFLQDVCNGFSMAGMEQVLVNRDPEKRHEEFEVRFDVSESRADARWVGDRQPTQNEIDPSYIRNRTLVIGGGSVLSARRGRVGVSGEKQLYDLTVVVPVYNNGEHLRNKCFESLRRSTVFSKMKILLIDDGSTDGETPIIIEELTSRFPNVDSYRFETGGSGSASRPRNKGLELADTPYITYLDPDNEAVGDGFARLLLKCQKHSVDFAIGNMTKLAKKEYLVDNAGILRDHMQLDEDGVGDVSSHLIADIKFQPMSIQALVANTAWLKGTGLSQPVGALGQDSFFFQQMLHAADRLCVVDEVIHSYYGVVAGSVINTVSPKFFQKYLPLERARHAWLSENDLLDTYIDERAIRFFKGWFVPRYNKQVHELAKEEAFQAILEIFDLYSLVASRSADGNRILEIKRG